MTLSLTECYWINIALHLIFDKCCNNNCWYLSCILRLWPDPDAWPLAMLTLGKAIALLMPPNARLCRIGHFLCPFRHFRLHLIRMFLVFFPKTCSFSGYGHL